MAEDLERILKRLDRVTTALEQATEALNRCTAAFSMATASAATTISAEQKQVGFGEPPAEVTYIFIERNGDKLWHTVNFDSDEQIPIVDRSLTGVVTKLRTVEGEYEGKKRPKLDIYIKADKSYIVRTGATTQFAKGFLLAMNELSLEQLRNEVTIEVDPSQKKKTVVFCRLYSKKERVKAEWNADANWQAIFDSLNLKLSKIHGYSISVDESNENMFVDRDEYDYVAQPQANSKINNIVPIPIPVPSPIPSASANTPSNTKTPLAPQEDIDREALIDVSTREMRRLHWDIGKGKAYLQNKYEQISRHNLTDQQLYEFTAYLKSLPTPPK